MKIKNIYVQGYPHFIRGTFFTGWILNGKCVGYCKFSTTTDTIVQELVTFINAGVPVGKQYEKVISSSSICETHTIEKFSNVEKNVTFDQKTQDSFSKLYYDCLVGNSYFIVRYIPRYLDRLSALSIANQNNSHRQVIETSDETKTTTLHSFYTLKEPSTFLIPFIPSSELLGDFDEADYVYLKNPDIIGRLVEISKEQQTHIGREWRIQQHLNSAVASAP